MNAGTPPDTGNGESLLGWQLIPLKWLARIKYGLGQPPRQLDGGLPLIRATNVSCGKIIAGNLMFVDPHDIPYDRDPVLRTNDLIVVRSGAYTGDSAIVPPEYEGAISGYDMVVRCERAEPRFIGYGLLSTPVLRDQIDLCRSRAAQPHLNAEELGNCLFLVPGIGEQRAIADYLDRKTTEIDDLIVKKRRMIDLLHEKRQALISEAVTKGIDPDVPMKDSGFPWLGSVPAHWSVERLRWRFRRIGQGWSPQCEGRRADPGEWGVLKVGCMNSGTFDESENKALPPELAPLPELEVRVGHVLMSRSNTVELVGAVGMVHQTQGRILLCDKLYRLEFDGSMLLPSYSVHLLRSRAARLQIERDATGASSSMKNISNEVVANMVFAFPPLDEQVRINEFIGAELRRLEFLEDTISTQIERLREYRLTLISDAVTGKIDLTLISDAVTGKIDLTTGALP